MFSRAEDYPAPASRPNISFGDLRKDLFRRDFTINALASKSLACNKSDIVDFYDGLSDINKKTLRVIHEKSFSDDPIRVIRGVRFKFRFGFDFDGDTNNLIKATILDRTLSLVTLGRRYFEFQKIFAESFVREIILELVTLGVFNQFMGISDDFDSDRFCNEVLKEDIITEITCLKALLIIMNEEQKLKYLAELPISKKMKLTLRDLV